MDEQGYRFGVGVLVVASLVIAIILVLFFGAAPNFLQQNYEVTIRFEAAPGVATDTVVRKNGVRIGRVKAIQLLDDRGVDLTLELDSQYKVRAGELARVGKGSLITGDAVVEFIPPTQGSLVSRFDGSSGSPADGMLDENEQNLAQEVIQDGDFFSGGVVAPDPFDALSGMQESLTSTMSAIEVASNEITALTRKVQTTMTEGDGDLKRISQKAELTIDNFNRTLAVVENLFRDPNIKATIDTVANRLPQLVDEAESVLQQADSTMEAFEGVGLAAEETMRNVRDFTEPLGAQGEEIVAEVRRTIGNADALMVDLRKVSATVERLTSRLNNGQGTLARLADDDQMYFKVLNTLDNIETLTRRLQPIVEDVRVVTDKVARNPSSLVDIRGQIIGRPRSGGVK